jgi:pyruvate/2-oxoglutarate dehydrogenase complex dihydrolipoamide dehydrogenase (E3) component
MELDSLPESMIVIGGGPQGLEIAQMFTHFGSRISVVMTHSAILPK